MAGFDQANNIPSKTETDMTEGKVRHGCLTAFLVVSIIASSLAAMTHLFGGGMMQQAFPDAPGWAFAVLGIASIFNIVCLIAILQWKKWGFYGAVASGLFAFFGNLAVGLDIGQTVLGLAGIAVLYGVLQIGGEKKGWTHLE